MLAGVVKVAPVVDCLRHAVEGVRDPVESRVGEEGVDVCGPGGVAGAELA